MMNKYNWIEKIIMLFAILLILAGGGLALYYGIGKSKERKEKVVWIKKCKAYENAPITTVEVIKDSIVYKEKVVYRESEPIYIYREGDTTKDPCKSAYSTPVRWSKDGLTWRFLATLYSTDCLLDSLEISNAVLPKETIIQTRRIDTCEYKEPEYKPMNHWIASVSISGKNVKQMPNIGLGIGYSMKDVVVLSIDGEYNFYHSEPYIRIRGGVYLDRIFKPNNR